MTIRAKQSVAVVYVVMKGSLNNERVALQHRLGRIHTVWDSYGDAQAEIEWQIDRETSMSGQQTNGYWIDTRGVVTTREDETFGN